MEDCLFCKIAAGKIDTDFVYSDEKLVVFEDINPQAPVHLLIVPKKHISDLNNLEEKDNKLIGHIYQVAKELAAEKNIAESGYRIVSNCNQDGGQTVYHIHFHLLGGRKLQWPPG
ncbi:histidine triad nucleotide-binding protein [Halanaerobium sp. Z-7514]|uniref:Histidine triad nucleotide-binding protein n=1 Tax=Halanaerobium polyolivorans TaxID=2886943 RepID=A0AAW4X0S1_9FIRM|nr:histidine triad nucleotide-binding protein [Halanaerobium polyolivorans]MCC3145397.1 histidine triad nucleotide-binding protein [Halanaerobium polyolivorans]RQD69914.1 MAG: histidine triad nucleotide-binding protein [Halanaerobium sp. MSAO_Bac5]